MGNTGLTITLGNLDISQLEVGQDGKAHFTRQAKLVTLKVRSAAIAVDSSVPRWVSGCPFTWYHGGFPFARSQHACISFASVSCRN